MHFFYLTIPRNQSYAYAYKDMSLERINQKICTNCFQNTNTPIYNGSIHSLVLDGGDILPDHLNFCGAGGLRLVISKETKDIFEKSNISGISEYELVNALRNTKQNSLSPLNGIKQYYLAHIQGKIEIDFKAMKLKKKKYCPICGRFQWNRQRLEPIFLDLNSWDKCDVCVIESMPTRIVLSKHVFDVVKENGLCGFEFVPYQIKKTD